MARVRTQVRVRGGYSFYTVPPLSLVSRLSPSSPFPPPPTLRLCTTLPPTGRSPTPDSPSVYLAKLGEVYTFTPVLIQIFEHLFVHTHTHQPGQVVGG